MHSWSDAIFAKKKKKKSNALTGSYQSPWIFLVKISSRDEDIDARYSTDSKQFKINMKSKMIEFTLLKGWFFIHLLNLMFSQTLHKGIITVVVQIMKASGLKNKAGPLTIIACAGNFFFENAFCNKVIQVWRNMTLSR